MKTRFLAIAALVLGLASCQNDFEGERVNGSGEVDFQLSVGAEELATRAGTDGNDALNGWNSAYGAIDYLKAEADAHRFDWTDVDLRYSLEVYDVTEDADGNKVVTNLVPVKDRQVKIVDNYSPVVFDLRLVPGREYRFVVFADFVEQGATANPTVADQANIGLRHDIGATLQEITVKENSVANERLNDEIADAYFATKDITITNSAAQDMVLRRPYGKLRVIATDLAELNLNVEPNKVKVTYTAANPNKFNAVTGEIEVDNTPVEYVINYDGKAGKTSLADYTYTEDYDAKTVKNANNETRHSHITLFTDYILADTEQNPINFNMEVFDRNGDIIKETTFNTAIPVQRNYLTTVIGNVLTTASEIEVRIDDNFAGENVENMVFVNTIKEFQEALDNYVNGQTIILEADIKGNVTVDQVEGKDYVIDGNGNNYDGTIYIDGNSRNDGTETVTIRNFNFATDSSDINFIEQNSADGAVRYAHNVTIENCSFRATGVNVVAVKIRQGYNITIKNCVADGVTRANDSGMHSLGQFYGCTGITIDGVNFNNAGEGGVSFGTSTNVVVKNSTFVTGYYGVRADASVATTLKLENVNITAMVPVIARQCTADYAIELTGDNTMAASGYHIVFTKGGDRATFVAPTSNFSVTGADKFNVFPGDKMYAYNAEGLQYFLDNAVDGDTIELAADIEGDVTVTQKPDVKIAIEGYNHKYAGVITVDGQSKTYTTAGVTIKNLNFEAETISADACVRLGVSGDNNTRYACNVAVEDCTFNVPGAVAVKSYTGGDKNLSIKGCTGTGLHSLLQVKNIEGVTIEGVNITGGRGASFGVSSNIVVKNSTFVAESYGLRVDATAEATLAIENVNITAKLPVVARNTSKNYAINFTGENNLVTGGYQVVFTTGDDEKAFVAPAEYTLTGADNFKVFPRDAADNNFIYNVDEFKKAIEAGNDGETIILQGGVFEGTFVPRSTNLTIKSADANNKATIKGRVNIDNYADGIKFENIKFDINDDSKVKNSFTGANYKYPATVVIYASATNFEGCEFKADIASGVCGINYGAHAPGKLLKVNNCKFKGDFYAIRTRTLFEITNNEFDIYTAQGTLSAVWTWGNGEANTKSSSGANKVVFTGNNNVNANKVYGVQLTSTAFNYCHINYNVQGNTNFYELKESIYSACDFEGKTFEAGSETF